MGLVYHGARVTVANIAKIYQLSAKLKDESVATFLLSLLKVAKIHAS